MAQPPRRTAGLDRALARAAQNHRAGRLDEARRGYLEVLAADPEHPDALHLLGVMAGSAGDHVTAAQLIRRSLRRKRTAEALLHLGIAQAGIGASAEGLAALTEALRLDPRNAAAHHHLGNLLSQTGRREEARAAYRAAIELQPDLAEAYSNLGLIVTWREGDPEARALLSLAEREEALAPAARIHLQYALGKYFDDLGDTERAFAHWRQGAALKRRTLRYDADAEDRVMGAIADSFPAGPWAGMRGQGCPSELPIFVLGMPRSGTSLVEQILASHPDVHGAGEVPLLRAALTGLEVRPELLQPPSLESGPFADALRRRGAGYIAQLQALGPEAKRVTDKLPNNFRRIGAIHLTLPRAAIVFCRRDLRDVCLSCYQTLFMKGHPWSYDLVELARYAAAFSRLMEHWRAVLPGRVFELDYEALVADPQTQVRRLLEHCGLGWDEGCLSFHASTRPVRTASLGQVRKPLHAGSVGRWRRYERQLAPLLKILERAGRS
jgi:Flp pilus assembly protein TadD